jgi:glycosyltransferase involved in cell wall biosynthesis
MYKQYKNVTRQAFSQASGIGYISNYIKNEAQMLMPATRKRDTYIGVGVDHFEAIRRIDFSEKPKLIVMYGAAFSHKNRMYAIKLFSRLLQEDSTYCFMIIGPIPSEGTLIHEEEDLISQISQIIIKPWISDEELRDTVAKARLVIYPTVTEGFGFVPFEAAQLGTPTLFNLNTSLKEVLAGANLSLQYNLETDLKTLQQLLADETANYELLSFIRETSLNFSWKNASGRIENWITDLLDEVNNQSTIYLPNNFIQQKLDVIQRVGSYRLIITILPLYTKRRKFMKKLALNLFRHKYI